MKEKNLIPPSVNEDTEFKTTDTETYMRSQCRNSEIKGIYKEDNMVNVRFRIKQFMCGLKFLVTNVTI